MREKTVEVLLVENDPGDVDLTREVLKESKVLVHLNVVEDGVKALEYLRKQGLYSRVVRPDVILLDLNLPKQDGRQVLREIKNDERLKMIPVVILSTSDSDTDILRSYGLGGNCYVTKPGDLQHFTQIIKAIQDFWFTLVQLPPR